jgi:hypothetical protein
LADGTPALIQPSKDGSPPHIIPDVRPPKTPAEERTEAEKRDLSRKSEQMLSTMGEARKILKAGVATGSGIGTAVDSAARMVGKSTPGAIDAGRLQALSGWLVANVPRMEGPQSNFDVQNYTTMAGKVGDSTVPIAERLAALDTVEKLQKKYAGINGVAQPSKAPKAQGGWSITPVN